MQFYRLFLLNGVGHIEAAHEFEAENDDAAITIAAGWREGREIELWQRDRQVKHWARDER